MADDVRTADVVAKAERIVEQYKAWQQWQGSLHKNPDDWQAFRRDLLAADMDNDDELDEPNISFGTGTGKTELARAFFEAAFESARSQWLTTFHNPDHIPSETDEMPDSRSQPAWFATPVLLERTDPLAAARARGQQMQRDILATQGEMLDANEVASRLQIGPDEVEQRRQEGLLLGLPLEDGRVGFPAWQFTNTGLLPGLEDVLRELGVRNVWMRAAFFLSGDLRLNGRTPLEILLLGDVDAVRDAGAAYGEQLAS